MEKMTHSNKLRSVIDNLESVEVFNCILTQRKAKVRTYDDDVDPVCCNEIYLFHLTSFQLKLFLSSLQDTIQQEDKHGIQIHDESPGETILENGIEFDVYRLGIFNSNFILRINKYTVQYFCLIVENMHSINLIISTGLYSNIESNIQGKTILSELTSDSFSLKGSIFGIHGRVIQVSKFENIMITVCCILKLRHADIEYNKNYDILRALNLKVMHNNLKVATSVQELISSPKLRVSPQNTELREIQINKTSVTQHFKIIKLTSSEVSYIIGKRGNRINRLKEATNCHIKIMTQAPGNENDCADDRENHGNGFQYVRLVAQDQSCVDACLKLMQDELSMFEIKNEVIRLNKLPNS